MQLPVLPSQAEIDRSIARRCDSFYKPPQMVAVFMDRARNESPTLIHVKLWSILRQVNIVRRADQASYILTYDTIEDNIVYALDACAAFARGGATL